MKTKEEIEEEIKRVEAILKHKEENHEWDGYEYYEERLFTLDWVLME